METTLSAIKPTGQLTLGNYLGALRNFPKFQDESKNIIFIADLHALTLPISPEVLRENTRDVAAFYLAAGLDPKKTIIFLQSMVHQHSELSTIIGNYAYMGEMSRMTQFKEKSSHLNEKSIGLGIFTYPVLMAADIVLYNATKVPVGEDQKQHVELCRNLVTRFNHLYGDILTLPEPVIPTVGARIMSLSDPTKKMSKSDPKGDIFLKDDEKTIRKKIMSAVTDMETSVHYDKVNKPGISNLMTIYASIKNVTIEDVEKEFVGANYGTFKRAVADAIVAELTPFQNRYKEIIATGELDRVLKEGAEQASKIAEVTLEKVKKAIGLYQVK